MRHHVRHWAEQIREMQRSLEGAEKHNDQGWAETARQSLVKFGETHEELVGKSRELNDVMGWETPAKWPYVLKDYTPVMAMAKGL